MNESDKAEVGQLLDAVGQEIQKSLVALDERLKAVELFQKSAPVGASAPVPQHMAVADFKLTEEYRKLSPKQKMFVLTYDAAGDTPEDRIFAVQSSYDTKDRDVARRNAYIYLKSPKVQRALDRLRGLDVEAAEHERAAVAIRKRVDQIALGKAKVTPTQLNGLLMSAEQHGIPFSLKLRAAQPSSNAPADAAELESEDVQIGEPVAAEPKKSGFTEDQAAMMKQIQDRQKAARS